MNTIPKTTLSEALPDDTVIGGTFPVFTVIVVCAFEEGDAVLSLSAVVALNAADASDAAAKACKRTEEQLILETGDTPVSTIAAAIFSGDITAKEVIPAEEPEEMMD